MSRQNDTTRSHRVSFGGRKMPVPRSRWQRMTAGALLVAGGILGFLPVLGLWMLPLGVLVLSVDLPVARRLRRRVDVWWGRKRKGKANGAAGEAPTADPGK